MWSVGLRVQLQRCGSSREAKGLNGRGRKWFAWMNGTVEGKKERKKKSRARVWAEEKRWKFRLSEHRLGVRYECLVCATQHRYTTYRCVAVGDRHWAGDMSGWQGDVSGSPSWAFPPLTSFTHTKPCHLHVCALLLPTWWHEEHILLWFLGEA